MNITKSHTGSFQSGFETFAESLQEEGGVITAPQSPTTSEHNAHSSPRHSHPQVDDMDISEIALELDSNGTSIHIEQLEYGSDEPGETDCPICFETFPRSEFPSRSLTKRCKHAQLSCCLNCLQSSIKTDLEERMWNFISCPECSSRLAYEDVREFADPETFERYDKLSSRAAIGSLPNFVWCMSCSSGQIHDDGAAQPIVECHECGNHSCFKHRTPWHINISCKEYDRLYHKSQRPRWQRRIGKVARLIAHSISSRVKQVKRFLSPSSPSMRSNKLLNPDPSTSASEGFNQTPPTTWMSHETRTCQESLLLRDGELKANKHQWKQERKSKRAINKTCKVCPGPGCGWPIQKNKGCPHITCSQCHYEFCYECLVDYNGVLEIGNNQHKPSCRYYADLLP